jgi:2'-hydroxyisoflavone reductase
MKLLVLGGTRFLGRHLVDAALARGHQVTTFTRGEHDAVLPARVERLQGNRDGELTPLHGRTWDAVVDTSGYFPRVVRGSAELLSGAVTRYAFISSISVYRDFPTAAGIDESSPVGTLANPAVEEVTGETYGPLKALCEDEIRRVYDERALIIRPGLIVGPYDPTNRFTYWPHRVAQGGEVLAPGRPDRAVQFIYARDLADWTVRMVEREQGGTFNAALPERPVTLRQVLDDARATSGSDARFTWVSDVFLKEQGVGEWMEMPLWAPEAESPSLHTVNCQKAWDAGLAARPLTETIRDTLAWRDTQPAEAKWPAGMQRDRESELLAKWHEARS